jgi:site-specific DNA-methyltransferase (adenine-specific)
MLNLLQNPKWDIARVSHSTLVNADCFDVFPFIEDKSIDAIICDLPYGTTACKWDSVLPLDKLWNEYKRILKINGVVVLTSTEPFTSVLISSNIKGFKYCWYWDRCIKSNFLNAKHQPIRHIETIPVFYNGKPTYNPILKPKRKDQVRWNNIPSRQKQTDTLSTVGYLKNRFERREIPLDMDYPTEMLVFSLPSANKGRNHPTEKPLELMEYLIKTYTNEGDMVLDNTMGSGTTNLACLKLNRKSIGIEKEKQYYDVAVRRLYSYCG